MDKKIIFASILLTLLFVGSAGMNILQANQSKESHVQQERYEKQLSDKDSELKDTSERLSNIEKRYQKLYKEKNGATNERISRITKKIFTALYTYDTKNQTVQDRKEKLKGKTSFQLVEFYSPDLAERLTNFGLVPVAADSVVLKPTLLK